MELPFGTLPPLGDFLSRVGSLAHELILEGEQLFYVTGAINQGIDEELDSIGAHGEWLDPHRLKLTVRDGRGLYSLIKRLVRIEADFPSEFEDSPALLAADILNGFGYSWAKPEVTGGEAEIAQEAEGGTDIDDGGGFDAA